MNIFDPAGSSLPGRPGDVGLGTTFSFPYVTIEDVLPRGRRAPARRQRHNFPFSVGRNPNLPDYDDFIVVHTDALGHGP